MPNTELITEPVGDPTKKLVDLGVADEVIAGLKGRLSDLEANTPAGYEAVRAGITEVRSIRTGVESSRKSLKKSALEWGRKVDAEAKRVTGLLLEIEMPLKERKWAVDEARERALREAEEKKRQEAEAKAKAEREAKEREEAAQRAKERQEREAEEKRLAEERKRLEQQEAEQQRKLREEREKLDAERAVVVREREAIEAEKRKREEEVAAKERAVKEAAEKKAREEAEAERKKEEAARAEAKRLEAERLAKERMPDRERLENFADAISRLDVEVKTEWGKAIAGEVLGDLDDIASRLRNQVTQ